MPSLTTISSWYKYSQIEYFTPFMKLWLAFNSWYKQFLPNIRTDREAIDSIKNGSPIMDKFNSLIDATGDDADEFRSSLASLVKELRIQALINEAGRSVNFQQSDAEPNFRNLSTKVKTNRLNSGNFIRLDNDTIITSDKGMLFKETLEAIYQIRCGLIHGDFDIDNQRAQRLIKGAFIILNKTFSPVVLTEE